MTDSVPVYAFSEIGKAFARHGMTDHRAGRCPRPPQGPGMGVYFKKPVEKRGQ
jgi:hypothetical protein